MWVFEPQYSSKHIRIGCENGITTHTAVRIHTKAASKAPLPTLSFAKLSVTPNEKVGKEN